MALRESPLYTLIDCLLSAEFEHFASTTLKEELTFLMSLGPRVLKVSLKVLLLNSCWKTGYPVIFALGVTFQLTVSSFSNRP